MTEGMKKLLELRTEAEKYDGCLTTWSKRMEYPNYQAFVCLFQAKRFSERNSKALVIGAEVIKEYREREKKAIEQADLILAS